MKDHWRTTWTHMRRTPYQALAAILIMFLTFLISMVFVLTAGGFQIVLRYFETRPQVTAFLKDEATSSQVDAIKAKLAQTGKVKEVRYVSKEEALSIYREQNKNDPLLLEMVTANILPASLEVSTEGLTHLNEVAQILRDEQAVEEVIFQEDVVKTLDQWTKNIRRIGLGLMGFFGLVSILIILVIIGMKITLRKDEIEILQLLGASRWYIRVPFVLEGLFYGAVGAFLAWGIIYLLLLYLTSFILSFFQGISLLPVSPIFMLILLGTELIAGIVIGSLGSLLAVKRYLK
ncbi:FtsX-like permease family protein [Candidatus Shapirobacteria bacterium]|nr:FtsX-like permease family protein [Candidatus Shapirobacteria bacterium]